MSNYPYIGQLSPAVGNGLGGIPKRKDSSVLKNTDDYMRYVVALYGFDGVSTDESFATTLSLINGATVSNGPVTPLFNSTGLLNLSSANSYASISVVANIKFSGDFTIEGWFYAANWSISTGSGTLGLFGSVQDAAGSISVYVVQSTGLVKCDLFAVGDMCSAPLSLLKNNDFNHIALCRKNGEWNIYINGIKGSSITNSTQTVNSAITDFAIGYTKYGTPLGGYIDEIRITRDIARYTSSFSIPTSIFPR